MTELERVPDVAEVVEGKPEWEVIVSEWAEGSSQELRGQLRQARAAAAVVRHYGASSVEGFAKEVGVSKSKVYAYRKVWKVYGRAIEDGTFPELLETLNISQMIECTYEEDPIKALLEAHDDGKPAAQIQAQRKETQQTEAEEDFGKPEVVEAEECPACGALSDHWQRPPRGV